MSSAKHSKKFSINQPINILFPLFSAEGEKLWVPGWDYTNIMGSTDLHEDYIFLTKIHDHPETDAVWLVKRYEPDFYFIQFYKVEPGLKIGVITVKCTEIEKHITEVEVTYEWTGISDNGNEFISEFDYAHYEEFINVWETSLNTYFKSIK